MWDSAAEASRWWEQAENDLEFARMALREEFFHQACFIAQQSAEKAVKAIGYRLGDRTILGHSVVVLVARYAEQVPSLADLGRGSRNPGPVLHPDPLSQWTSGGVPFAAFHESQAGAAIEAAERFVKLAHDYIQARGTGAS